MSRGSSALICLAICLALAACTSGQSSSDQSGAGPDPAAALESKAAYLEGLFARRALAADVLDALTLYLPDRVWLTEVAYDPAKVRFKGNAATNNLLADYIVRLSQTPSLADVTLGGSVLKAARGREWVEFTLEARVSGGEGAAGPETALPPQQDSAATLRDLQRPALDAGLQLTRLAPGTEVPGEYATEQVFAVDVQGGRTAFARYLRSLAGLPGLWIVERFSLKAVSPQDARSDIGASITVRLFSSP